MNLEVLKDKTLDFARSIGNIFIKELEKSMNSSKMTDVSKENFQNVKKEILSEYNIYEVKDRGVYKYSKNLEYPEFNKELYSGQKNGYYIMNDSKELIYDEQLNSEINQKLNNAKDEILKNQNQMLNNYRKKGEEYIVDELGDDDKKVYLTRKSDNLEFEDFEISDELYRKIQEKNMTGEESILVWNGNYYVLK